MKTILVTGGAGYIGSHVCKALAENGYFPIAYDNLTYGHPWAVQWGPLEKGDLRDVDRLRSVIAKHKPEGVVHMAAYTSVGESVANPAKYYQNNVMGSLALLDAMKEEGVARIVFSGSAAIFGIPKRVPIAEDDEANPINPYGMGKLMVEKILRDYDAGYGIRSISLRYFNACGADPSGAIGEDHEPETHLIPNVLKVALGRMESLNIFGDDYDTPDGSCVRDYVHVSDLAAAHVLALKRLENGGKSGCYNLGSGKGFSVKEIVGIAREVTGRDIPVKIAPRRPGDPSILVCDPSRASRELGWMPQYPKLSDPILHAWRWAVK